MGGERADDRLADARVVEDVLDHDDAADQPGGVEGDRLDRRPERVRQRVPPDHPTLGNPAQAQRLHVLAVERLDHRPAHEPDGVRKGDDEQRRDGQDEALEPSRRRRIERERRDRREHPPVDGEQRHQDDADDEVGEADGEQHRAGDGVVERTVTPYRGEHAERERTGDQQRPASRRSAPRC